MVTVLVSFGNKVYVLRSIFSVFHAPGISSISLSTTAIALDLPALGIKYRQAFLSSLNGFIILTYIL